MVVVDGDEFHTKIFRVGGRVIVFRLIVFEKGVPDVGGAVVFGAAEDADVDEVAVVGKFTLPADAGVGGEHHVGVKLGGERVEELGRRGALPQEFIHLPRAAVAQEHFERSQFES